METHNTHLKSHGQVMTDKQIRDVVTPYEFGVSDAVIGTPLARPLRRGLALLVDLFLVVMLTHLPSILLAAVGVVFFWRAGKKKNASPRFGWLRKILKGFAAILLFGILIAVFDSVNSPNPTGFLEDDREDAVLTGVQGLGIAAILIGMPSQVDELEADIANQRCEPYRCWQDYLANMSEDVEDIKLPPKVIDEIIGKLRPGMQRTLTDEQTATLLQTFRASLRVKPEESVVAAPSDTTVTGNAAPDDSVADSSEADTAEPQSAVGESPKPSTDASKSAVPVNENGHPSLLAWAQGLLEDLGIGFGWAALYFTACTFWMKGQTPGKWLFGLKVIKLDGSTMTLWESFERYGGYGAGLATGLLGFAQIFWEPNRQAIHDKISETLVIHLGLDKVPVQAIHDYRAQSAMAQEDQLPSGD